MLRYYITLTYSHPDYRWFPEGKVIFVAPTKPLVSQQIEACHEACGIPGTDAAELTGNVSKAERSRYVSHLPNGGLSSLFPNFSLVYTQTCILHDASDTHERFTVGNFRLRPSGYRSPCRW